MGKGKNLQGQRIEIKGRNSNKKYKNYSALEGAIKMQGWNLMEKIQRKEERYSFDWFQPVEKLAKG